MQASGICGKYDDKSIMFLNFPFSCDYAATFFNPVFVIRLVVYSSNLDGLTMFCELVGADNTLTSSR